MSYKSYYKPGDFNVRCDRTGFKLKRTQCRGEWTGNTVRKESWEPRHEQDLIRSFPDDQSVFDPNPPTENYFLDTNEVHEALIGPVATHLANPSEPSPSRRIFVSPGGDHLIVER